MSTHRPEDHRRPADDSDLDARLTRSGRRVADTTTTVAGDLGDVLHRSRQKRKHTSMAGTVAFVAVLLLLAGVGVRRGTYESQLALGDDGRPIPATTATPNTTVSPTTTITTSPPPNSPAVGPQTPCSASTFEGLIHDLRHEPVARVDRYACLDAWATARVETLPTGPVTYVFKAVGSDWKLLSEAPDADLVRAMRAASVPIDTLFQIMGLTIPTAHPTTTFPFVIRIVERDAPPAEIIGKVTRHFIEDAGEADLHGQAQGDHITVYDGMLLTETTARRFSEDERMAIAAAFEAAGFSVDWSDVTGDATNTALLFADPSLEPNHEPFAIPEDHFGFYLQLQGCVVTDPLPPHPTCGMGATYEVSAPIDGGWQVVNARARTADAPTDTTLPDNSSAVRPTTTSPVESTIAPEPASNNP